MYVWLWRVLPGGFLGKLVLSTLLAAAVVALLFFRVFPAVEPLLPLNDVTVDGDASQGQVQDTPAPSPAPSPALSPSG